VAVVNLKLEVERLERGMLGEETMIVTHSLTRPIMTTPSDMTPEENGLTKRAIIIQRIPSDMKLAVDRLIHLLKVEMNLRSQHHLFRKDQCH
jgi:hypothetical protein